TMYAQTNCFVGTKLEYGLFQSADASEVYVVTERAARNMAFQDLSPANGQVVRLGTISGQAIIGTKVNAPLSCYADGVYVLPMENVLATKGTGVVTSVPSDSPDDYAVLRDLKKKADFYGIQPAWVDGYEPRPVISTAAYGEMVAPALCDEMRINSQKDRDQLAKAKEVAYKEGFYNGTMSVGEFKGQSVQEAKPKVRELLIATGDGFAYAEPEGLVMSRSADECVVALCDQWYFDYGEAAWKAVTEECLASLDMCSSETHRQLQRALHRLHQWACVRSYGLGTKVPWDPTLLIESLSDSTIYMSYYTVAHLLHRSLDGSAPGPLGITPGDMDGAAWDHVLLGRELPAGHSKAEALDKLRRSFLYWYPVDIRSTGKDLIQNHLTFFLYVHTALFGKAEWPRSVRANGHLLLNGEKMSKSTGNMISLRESCNRYGADATRLALADVSDGIEDANFEESTANAAVLRLFTLMEWATEAHNALEQSDAAPDQAVRAGDIALRPASSPMTTVDRVFDAEMDALTLAAGAAYERTMYRDALTSGFYEFTKAREWYTNVTADTGMHPALLRKYISRQAILLAPITPHWAEHVWKTVVGSATSIMEARWPADLPSEPDYALLAAGDYVRKVVKSVRCAEGARRRRITKKGAAAASAGCQAPKSLDVLVACDVPKCREDVAESRQDDPAQGAKLDKRMSPAEGSRGGAASTKAASFAQETKRRVDLARSRALADVERLDEAGLLREVLPYLKWSLGYDVINIVDLADAGELDEAQTRAAGAARPGSPGFLIRGAP
ncbi:cytosolic leucyl tRNA synthetase, partial [Coemansia biformis]